MKVRLLQKMQRLLFLFHAKAAYFHAANPKSCDYIHGGHHIKKDRGECHGIHGWEGHNCPGYVMMPANAFSV